MPQIIYHRLAAIRGYAMQEEAAFICETDSLYLERILKPLNLFPIMAGEYVDGLKGIFVILKSGDNQGDYPQGKTDCCGWVHEGKWSDLSNFGNQV